VFSITSAAVEPTEWVVFGVLVFGALNAQKVRKLVFNGLKHDFCSFHFAHTMLVQVKMITMCLLWSQLCSIMQLIVVVDCSN
jgi:ammonia channel protein AmtB